MDYNKFRERQRAHRALAERAAQFREAAAKRPRAEGESHWDCGRGHEWDDAVSAAQNVRCMNCAAQRREMRTSRLHALAHARGGNMLSAGHVEAATPLRWQCAFGHVWEARAEAIEREWCAECVRAGVYDLDDPLRCDEAMSAEGDGFRSKGR